MDYFICFAYVNIFMTDDIKIYMYYNTKYSICRQGCIDDYYSDVQIKIQPKNAPLWHSWLALTTTVLT